MFPELRLYVGIGSEASEGSSYRWRLAMALQPYRPGKRGRVQLVFSGSSESPFFLFTDRVRQPVRIPSNMNPSFDLQSTLAC
jgi:hypothetical protein